jgi:putative ABC transport system permease protein
MTVRLTDPSAFESFEAAVSGDPRLDLRPQRELDYYAEQSRALTTIIRVFGSFVTLILSIGAVFGAMNTMYGIVAARTREIGTLRALGFSRISILVSFVIESTFLAVVGALLGCLIALPANGMTSSAGGANFAEVAFAFKISTFALGVGIVFGAVMGIVGGLLPAVKASRLPITTALREA